MDNINEALTAFIISIMSFLGWGLEEYKTNISPFIQPKIAKQIQTQQKTEPAPSSKQIISTTQSSEDSKISTEKPELQKKPQPTPIPPPKPLAQPPPQNTTKSPISPVPKPTSPPPPISIEAKTKSSVANIFCTEIKGDQIQKTTGSAVAISNNGVLLTNAHVAEHVLIANTQKNLAKTCAVRTGSPATKAYNAKVVYIPTEWIYANKDNLKYSSVSGTGENDFALIVLTEKIQGNTAQNLSFIETSTKPIQQGDSIVLSGYPAFGAHILDNALYNVLNNTKVTDIWRLNTSPSDLGGTGQTVLATNGSSGGAVTTQDGKLIGIMVATTVDKHTNKPNIRFISYDYIQNNIKSKTGKTIDYFIKNAESEANRFLEGEGLRLANILTN